MAATAVLLISLGIVLLIVTPCYYGQFQWHSRDNFDEIRNKLDKVTPQNCKVVDINELFLPASTVTHVPDIKTLGIDPVFPNRTNLLHIHNMAMSRAFFLSFILQKARDEQEPGFMYYFLSTISDVAANRFINASAFYFAPNMAFTPSYKGFFNKTMPLFAPRAFRADDFNDPYHLQGTSTLNTIQAIDLGAVPNNSISANYTHEQYKINEWYKAWLPDLTKRHDSKTTYTVHITYNGTNETFVWHGPPAASDILGPVKWFKPYFDCNRSNKWVYGATVPIPDIFPRHTGWRHIEIPTYVAVAVMEIDFERLDINQCPLTGGNPGPNYFAGTARCKNLTTECEPIHGFGFRRGGYQCRCRPGYRLPKVVRSPYLGEIIERAADEEYKKGFHCEKINYLMVLPQYLEKLSPYDRNLYIAEMENFIGKSDMNRSSQLDPNVVHDYIRKEVNAETCHEIAQTHPEKLTLLGSIAYGKETQLENEARTAIRLANFLSAFQQIVNPAELFAELRLPDQPLSVNQLIGEVLSNVIGNQKIQGCGIFFDRHQFVNHTYFAPYAYRIERNTRDFYVIDLAGKMNKSPYTEQEWFKHLKTRWSSNIDELETYTTKIQIRYNSSGQSAINYEHYPMQYKAADIRHGYWTSPYFDCGGLHEDWLITYASPFFGWDKIRSRLEFKGVVTVSVKLEELDINQCSDDYYVQNAFKDTHKCDRRSSWCIPILGRGFRDGGYKCECKQGFEYPFNERFTYFDGQVVEAEYEKMVKDKPSRFDTLKCRIAAAGSLRNNIILVGLLSMVTLAMSGYLRWFRW